MKYLKDIAPYWDKQIKNKVIPVSRDFFGIGNALNDPMTCVVAESHKFKVKHYRNDNDIFYWSYGCRECKRLGNIMYESFVADTYVSKFFRQTEKPNAVFLQLIDEFVLHWNIKHR